jgi:hypothetical protein
MSHTFISNASTSRSYRYTFGTPVVMTSDGTQDALATIENHRKLNTEHAQRLEEQHAHSDSHNSESATVASDDNPVVTKPDGTQDTLATVEKHRQLNADHVRRLEDQDSDASAS